MKYAVMFLLIAVVPSCGPASKKVALDLAACAVGTVPGAVTGIIPDVQQALEGQGVDWAASLEGIGTKAGFDAVACAVKSLLAKYQHAELPAAKMWAMARGQSYLAAHGVK